MEHIEGVVLGRGRASVAFHAEVTRELADEDLLFRKATSVGSEARPLVKLRYQHHRLAQMLAAGIDEGEASLVTGYSISRISILKADPAFKDLLAHYIGQQKEVYADLQGRMAGFALDALDELQERLEEAPREFTNKELLETVKVANDRGGNSPIARSQSINVLLTPEELSQIKKEVKAAEHDNIIKGANALTHNPELAVGHASTLSTEVSEGAEAKRNAGEGQDL